MTDIDVLTADRFELGEGSRWAGGTLALVNITAGKLYSADAGTLRAGGTTLTEIAHLDEPLGAVAPIAGRPGAWLAAAGTGFRIIDPTGEVRRHADAEPVTDRAWRMNDAVADAAGRFWAGSMAYDQSPGNGALYRLDPDGRVHTVIRDLTIANGPAFSPDGRVMYLSDTPLGHIDRFDVDPATGTLSGRRPFARLDPEQGAPDGLTVDSDGYVWTALHGGAAVQRFRADGEPDRRIPVPARQPTSVCVAGGTLIVTSAREGLDDPGPADGAVLIGAAGATGLPARPVRIDAR